MEAVFNNADMFASRLMKDPGDPLARAGLDGALMLLLALHDVHGDNVVEGARNRMLHAGASARIAVEAELNDH
jgi:hypothetical protein